MNTVKIENGLLAEKNSVFVAFYTKPCYQYQTHEECRNWGEKTWNTKIALLGTMMRWDGSFGFVGGKVDEGESLIQAAMRETEEEAGTQISEEQLTLLCSHTMEDGDFKQNTHVFLCELTPDEIYQVQKNAQSSEHSKIENAGFNVVHMTDDAFENLPKLPWAGTAKEELLLMLNSGLIPKSEYLPNGTF